VPLRARGKVPVIWTPNKEYTGRTVKIAAETKELEGLIGICRSSVRTVASGANVFEPQQLEVVDATLPRSEEWIAYGKEVYGRRCVGCHG